MNPSTPNIPTQQMTTVCILKSTIPIALMAAFGCLIEPATASTMVYSQGSSPNAAYQQAGSSLFEKNPDQNDGSDPLYRVGLSPHNVVGQPGILGDLRTVLAFDLTDIPAGSSIDNIKLTLSIDSVEGNPGSINLYSLVTGSPFIEGTGIYPNGPNNGVTWNNLNGTFSTLLSSAPGAAAGTIDFLSSASFVATAQAALNANRPLQMILIATSAEASNANNLYRFNSDDAVNPVLRPRLTVNVVPEPGTVGFGLVLAGLCAGGRFRPSRRKT